MLAPFGPGPDRRNVGACHKSGVLNKTSGAPVISKLTIQAYIGRADTKHQQAMEMIMSTISTLDVSSGTAQTGAFAGLVAFARRCRDAYIGWCAERTAIALLNRMSDRELRDIGINRPTIPFAVRNGRIDPLTTC